MSAWPVPRTIPAGIRKRASFRDRWARLLLIFGRRTWQGSQSTERWVRLDLG